MIHKLVCGIDVGLTSAAAAIYGYTNGRNIPALIKTLRIPTIGEKAAKRIDVLRFSEWLIMTGATIAYIEQGSARSGQGSMSRYLRACGQIEATVTLAGLDGVLTQPGVWKKAIGLIKAQKNDSVHLARKVFPEHAATTFEFLHSHNVAEASLIALYAAARLDLVSIGVQR